MKRILIILAVLMLLVQTKNQGIQTQSSPVSRFVKYNEDTAICIVYVENPLDDTLYVVNNNWSVSLIHLVGGGYQSWALSTLPFENSIGIVDTPSVGVRYREGFKSSHSFIPSFFQIMPHSIDSVYIHLFGILKYIPDGYSFFYAGLLYLTSSEFDTFQKKYSIPITKMLNNDISKCIYIDDKGDQMNNSGYDFKELSNFKMDEDSWDQFILECRDVFDKEFLIEIKFKKFKKSE